MFNDPQISSQNSIEIPQAPRSIEDFLREANQGIGEGCTARTLALAIEANQQLLDYYDELLDAPSQVDDFSVTVSVNGTTVKFPDVAKMADFVSGWKEW